MANKYSRLKKTERRKNKKNAILYMFLSISLIVILIIYGIPLLARLSAVILGVRQGSEVIVQNDETPPAPPRLNISEEYTNTNSVDISGSAEPGATVFLEINNDTQETLTNNEGEFYFTLDLKEGDNLIRSYAVDAAGNESKKTDSYSILFDDEAPKLSVNTPENDSSYFGSKQRQIQIQGDTSEDARVTINDRVVIVDDDGSFSYTTTLSEGENNFKIKAEDKAGNTTEEELTVSYSE